MNVVGVMKYHWRRRWLFSVLFVAAVTAIALVSAIGLIFGTRQVSMALDAQGRVIEHVSYASVAFLDDPSLTVNTSAFSLLILVFTFSTLKRDRWFLVSVSVPRYQILLGTGMFLVTMTLTLALLGGIVAPLICRTVLLAMGIPIRGGWGLVSMLTNDNPALLADIYIDICGMIAQVGVFTLIGYLMLRWWKPILILFGAGVVAIILLVSMVRLETVLAQYVLRFADWIQWAAEQLIPRIMDFFSRESRMNWAWKQLIAGFLGMALSYPIMRGMKVV